MPFTNASAGIFATTFTVFTASAATTMGETLTTSVAPSGATSSTVKACASVSWFVNRTRCWFATSPVGSMR